MADSKISVPVKTSTFLKLSDFLKSQQSTCDPVDAVELAIDYWLDNAGWKAEDLVPGAAEQVGKGYHWKELFLPHRTSLRMRYRGDYFYAAVDGDRIMFEGNSVSPSEFANRVTNTSRNAWRDIWIQRPNDAEWKLADDLRVLDFSLPVHENPKNSAFAQTMRMFASLSEKT